jgi:outer membrane receptor protein involved in Fe transport
VGARVQCDQLQTASDRHGRFTLPRQGCTRLIHVTAAEFIPLKRTVPTSWTRLTLPLRPVNRIEEVVVVASRYAIEHESSSIESLDSWRLANTPELGDDAIRVVNQLPGVATIGLSARPHVRGGAADETLVVFNHVELLEPYHLKDFQSLFSSVNPALIASIDVYTGGFPTRYGDRLSGVMDIAPNNQFDTLGGHVSVSMLNLGAQVYGATDNGDWRWVAAGRRGPLGLISNRRLRPAGLDTGRYQGN